MQVLSCESCLSQTSLATYILSDGVYKAKFVFLSRAKSVIKEKKLENGAIIIANICLKHNLIFEVTDFSIVIPECVCVIGDPVDLKNDDF